MEKQFITEVAFQSDEYSDVPLYIKITLSDADIERIKALQQVAKEHNVTIEADDIGDAEYLDGDEQEHDWRDGYSCFKIYSNGSLYFYSQNKYHSGDQIESDEFSNKIFSEETVS